MTATAERPTHTGPAESGGTLGAVVQALGDGLVRLVTAPRGLAVPVGGLVLFDAVAETPLSRSDVVLAIGVDAALPSAIDVVARCGMRGATAVLLRCDEELPAALVAAADRSATALLVAPQDAAWGQLHTLLRTARSASHAAVIGARGGATADLFGIADALAAVVGGAVSIEDEQSTVLAYSTGTHPTDAGRQAAILGRRVPDTWVEQLTELGVFRHLVTSEQVVHVAPLGEPACAARLAVGVRAAGENLGSIWVQEGEQEFAPGAETALRQAASLVALHLLRARSGDDLERRHDGEQLRFVLAGRLPPTLLAETLRVSAEDAVVLLGLDTEPEPGGEAAVLADRVADLVVLSCRAFRRKAVATGLGRTAYAVVATGSSGAHEARHLADELSRQLGTGLDAGVRVAVVEVAGGVGGLRTAKQQVDLALRVVRRQPAGPPVHVGDLTAAMTLLQLADLASEHPPLRAGVLPALQEADRDRSSAYVPTLRAFLDAFGDVRRAADAVGVHPNTFRYRLRRLCELTGLDLEDPQQRLVVHLQLHLADT